MELVINESIEQGKVQVAMYLTEYFEKRVKSSMNEALIDAIMKSKHFDEMLEANTNY